jgi:magnesium chelatase subunit H
MAKAMEIEEPELLERLVDGVTEDQLKRSAKHLTAAQQDALHQLVHSNVLLNQESELNGLLRALDGRYALPAPGGDLLRNPDVLPTGRNLHGLDPFKLPTAFATRKTVLVCLNLLPWCCGVPTTSKLRAAPCRRPWL